MNWRRHDTPPLAPLPTDRRGFRNARGNMKGSTMGVLADILNPREPGTASYACVVNCDGPFEPDAQTTPIMLINGPGRTDERGVRHVIAVPAERDGDRWVAVDNPKRWRMFGGGFVTLGDSRLCRLVELLGGYAGGGAVPLHDRFENLP